MVAGSMKHDIPILEFDSDKSAMLEPDIIIKRNSEMPQRCVVCFFQDVIELLLKKEKIFRIDCLRSEMGRHPVYKINGGKQSVALFHPGVGAPLAAGFLEEVIALGGRKFIVCGGAGTLDSSHEVGKLMVPVSAIRDEGTSYHYLPSGREVSPTDNGLEAVTTTLTNKGVPFELTKTWTTDAIYRETQAKIELRKAEGCTCVEMEAAALFAVARFRNVEIAQILYAGDDLSGGFWDARDWSDQQEIRKTLLDLAVQACSAL